MLKIKSNKKKDQKQSSRKSAFNLRNSNKLFYKYLLKVCKLANFKGGKSGGGI